MVEQADTRDLKSLAVKSVPVRSWSRAFALPVADKAKAQCVPRSTIDAGACDKERVGTANGRRSLQDAVLRTVGDDGPYRNG